MTLAELNFDSDSSVEDGLLKNFRLDKGCANLHALRGNRRIVEGLCRSSRYPSLRGSAFLDILSGNRSDPISRLFTSRRPAAGAFWIVLNSTKRLLRQRANTGSFYRVLSCSPALP
jgi:hypothetical protein